MYSQLAISYNNDFGIEYLSHVGSQLENKIRKSECMDVSPTSNHLCVCGNSTLVSLWKLFNLHLSGSCGDNSTLWP